MPNFINVPQHGYSGDFYSWWAEGRQRHSTDVDCFRADDLDIATQIAFNNWLRDFDRLYQSCELIYIEAGRFEVAISNHSRNSGAIYGTTRRVFIVEYFGPANMFEANYLAQNAESNDIARYVEIMRAAIADGNPNVRLSKGGSNSANEAMPVFTCGFPRYRSDGEWWPSESMHLAYDDVALATDQMRHAGLIEG